MEPNGNIIGLVNFASSSLTSCHGTLPVKAIDVPTFELVVLHNKLLDYGRVFVLCYMTIYPAVSAPTHGSIYLQGIYPI